MTTSEIPGQPAGGARRWMLFAGAMLAWTTIAFTAPNPSAGTITESSPVIDYTGGVLAGRTTNGQCDDSSAEKFVLTTDLPLEFGTKTYSLVFVLENSAYYSYGADLVLTVRDVDGNHIKTANDWANAGESLQLPAQTGTTQYHVIACTNAGTVPDHAVHIELSVTDPRGSTFGGRDPVAAGVPRYQLFEPAGTESFAKPGDGEYNVGFNPHSRRIMAQNNLPVARVTPPEVKPDGSGADSGLPEACPALWEDKSSGAPTTLDPILWTDPKTGRSFSSNQTTGAAGGAYAYTDNDGDSWTDIGLGTPSGGLDHETIGSGPLPASMSNLATPLNQGQWVLYCSQNFEGSTCQRSLTLGTTWDTAQVATGPGTMTWRNCGGLHGHVKIAPDGTAYLPDGGCGSLQGGAVSIDTSTTPWTEFTVAGTDDRTGQRFASAVQSTGRNDPSIGIDADSTVYYCYINNIGGGSEGHAHVAVGRRTPGGTNISWLRDTDVGLAKGIRNAAFPEAWGGSSGRAACGFLGTDVAGSYQTATFKGDWYLFVATTYDQGRTWVTVSADPDDPVQHRAGICTGGSGCGGAEAPRNLLDFNEATADDKGRFIYGFSKGCVTPGCVARVAFNDDVAHMRIVRQMGGKSLFAAYDSRTDTQAPVAPKRPCLLDPAHTNPAHPNPSGRDANAAHLRWRAPDNGGADIVKYDIYRSTTRSGPYSLIGSTADATPAYDDTTSGTAPVLYYVVRANNAAPLASANSNEVRLPLDPLAEDPCVPPGLTILADPADDENDFAYEHDLRSLRLSEPYRNSATETITFTLKVASLARVPANSYWPVQFNVGASSYVVRMTTVAPASTAAPSFEYFQGTGNVAPAGTAAAADPASNYQVDGTITIVVPRSGIGNPAVGSKLTAFIANISNGAITADGSGAARGTYSIVGSPSCRSNLPPIAALSADPSSGRARLTVNFSGAGSSDPDTQPPADTIASYSFDFGDGSPPVTQPSPTLSHVYASEGRYFANLKVTGTRGALASTNKAEVEISVGPRPPSLPPVADAGDDFTVDEGAAGTLDGSGSADPDDDPLTFAWTQLSGPATALIGARSAAPGFTAPEVCTDTQAVFRLVVTDTGGLSSAADQVSVVLHNLNQAPIANAGLDFAVTGGTSALLSAVATVDPDCEALDYHWSQTAGPGVQLQGADTATPSFTAPDVSSVTALRFHLFVADPSGATSADDVTIVVQPDLTIGDNSVGALPPMSLILLAWGMLLKRARPTLDRSRAAQIPRATGFRRVPAGRCRPRRTAPVRPRP